MTTAVFALVMTSAFLHALWNFAARKASGSLSVFWLGGCCACLFCLPVVPAVPVTAAALKAALPFMGTTGIIHVLYYLLLSKAYEEGDISLVYPIARGTGVAGTAVAAGLLVGEQISPAGAAGIAGVALGILTLGLKEFRIRDGRHSGLYALLVGGTIVIYSLVDKHGVAEVHPVPYICSMFLISSLLLTPYMLARRAEEMRRAWRTMKPYVLIVGPGSMATYLMVLFAFQIGRVSYIVAAREFSVVIGSVMGFVFLGERLTAVKGVGIAAIVAGLVLLKLAD